jgi:hypothetical protein
MTYVGLEHSLLVKNMTIPFIFVMVVGTILSLRQVEDFRVSP